MTQAEVATEKQRLHLPKLKPNSGFLVYGALILLAIVLFIISPGCFTPTNLLIMARQAAPMGIVAIGQTFVIISGGIDLSVGSIILLTNVLTAGLIGSDESMTLPVILLCLGIAFIIGALNAFGTIRYKIPPLIMTLAMANIVSGACYIWTKGAPTGMIPASMRYLGMDFWGPFPIPVVFWLIFVVIGYILLQRNTFGRRVFATGSNSAAALHAGVSVAKVRAISYIMCSVLACATGILLSGYIGTTSMTLGNLYQFSPIIATVIGGTPFGGGMGSMSGTFAGTLMVTVLNCILTIVNMGPQAKQIINGLILIGIVLIYTERRRD